MYYVHCGPKPKLSYLALGDSYTVGTGGRYIDNFPNQVTKLLRQQHWDIGDPLIIAHSGWTTTMLADAILKKHIKDTFAFVTLLIGTNNQNIGQGIENYKLEFEDLLQQAITYTNGYRERVIVLSLPDWSVTPFAWNRDRNKVAAELEAYNAVCKDITKRYGCRYLDVTTDSRMHIGDKTYLAKDGLHPSAKQYALWAERIAAVAAPANP